MSISAALPTTAAEIVDLIRHLNRWGTPTIDRPAAIDLIEQYAAVVASEAAIKATTESFDKCIAITDAILSKPLATTARPERAG